MKVTIESHVQNQLQLVCDFENKKTCEPDGTPVTCPDKFRYGQRDYEVSVMLMKPGVPIANVQANPALQAKVTGELPGRQFLLKVRVILIKPLNAHPVKAVGTVTLPQLQLADCWVQLKECFPLDKVKAPEQPGRAR